MPSEKFRTEQFKVNGEELLARIKKLIHEGNIRRIIIKDKDSKTVMEIPMTLGVGLDRAAVGRHRRHRRVADRSDCGR